MRPRGLGDREQSLRCLESPGETAMHLPAIISGCLSSARHYSRCSVCIREKDRCRSLLSPWWIIWCPNLVLHRSLCVGWGAGWREAWWNPRSPSYRVQEACRVGAQGCCNKSPYTRWLKTTGINFLASSRSQKSTTPPPEAKERTSSLPLAAAGSCWLSLACGHISAVCLHLTPPSPQGVCCQMFLRVPFKDTCNGI